MLPPSIRHTLLTAFAVALAAGHACAQGTNPPAPGTLDTAKALGDINLAIKNLSDKLDVAMTRINADMTVLRDDVVAMKRDVGDLRSKSVANETELRRLNEEMTALKKRFDDMGRPATSSSGKLTATAKVRFSNRYTTEMNVFLNGTTFTVPANEEREVPVAAGSVIYQVLGYQAAAKYNTLSDNQMLTVTLRPAY